MIDAPMPLEAAVQACFPHGGASKATLLAACRRGALAYAKVGNRYLVTKADIAGWIEKCREKPKKQDPISDAEKADQPNSSYSTMDESMKLALENAAMEKLKQRLRNTSSKTTPPTRKNAIKPRLQLVK